MRRDNDLAGRPGSRVAIPASPDVASSGSPRHRPWRPWRSKVLWALAIAFVAFVKSDVRTSRDRRLGFRDGIRAFNRRWVNPLVLRFAGTRPWGVARLEHHGRRSGRLHATPVWAEPVSEGFLILMPYGRDVDWARNLLHAGEGVLRHQGVRYLVGRPRILPAAEARPDLPGWTRPLAGSQGISSFMRVDVLPNLTVEAPPPV